MRTGGINCSGWAETRKQQFPKCSCWGLGMQEVFLIPASLLVSRSTLSTIVPRLRPSLVWGNGRSLHPSSLTSWCIRGEARQTAAASSSPAFFLTERFTFLFCFILLWFFPVVSSGLALRMNSIRKHAGEDGKRILAKSQNGNNNTEIGVEPSPISPGCWEN